MDRFRPLSAAANSLRKQAMSLLAQIPRQGVLNRVFEIFLIRAAQNNRDGTATVLEVPAYLAGGYGGQDGARDFYTPFVIVDAGPILGALTSRKIRLSETGAALPNIPTDKYKGRAFTGSGRVVIGAVPAWEGFRQALNSTTGAYSVCRSAVTVAVCPSLSDEAIASRPWARSLTVCRANGSSGVGEVSNFDDGSSTGTYPVDVLPGHVMMTPTPPTGAPERISGLEIAADQLGIPGAFELQFAGSMIEWGALRGLVAVQYRSLSPSNAVLGNGLKFAAYEVAGTESEGEISYSGAVVALGAVDLATLPPGDAPTSLSEVTAADPSFTYPSWATNTTVYGRAASAGRLIMRDPNLYARLFSASMGYEVEAGQAAMTLVEVQCDIEAPPVSVRGYKSGPSVTFNTVEVPATRAIRWITYVASISPIGEVSLTVLADFLDSRYDVSGPLVRKQIQTFGGLTTRPSELSPYGEARLFCSEWDINYEVRAADADGPAPNLVQGEPTRRVQTQGSPYVRLADLSFYLLSPTGVKTPLLFGDYFPALFGISTSPYDATYSGRQNFGNSALRVTLQRVGNDFPLVQCQFAPGIMAVLIAPRSGYANATQIVRVALFSVETGAMLVLSPALFGVALPARMSLSCFEQGTVDDDGNLASYGRLLIGVSTTSASPTRSDGFFTVTGLRDLSWLAREPSNTSPHYVGNSLVPAEIGVTANLTFTKPTLA